MTSERTFLFISSTLFSKCNLTGAHWRFLELIQGLSKTNNIILISRQIPQLGNINAKRYFIDEEERYGLPKHIDGMLSLCMMLRKLKNKISYHYAISFGVVDAICYRICGYKNIISLFREDLIEYHKTIGVSSLKLKYYSWQERMAVRFSDKIIVQCNSDKINLIKRNLKYCKGIEQKVYVQINNVDALWINKKKIIHKQIQDGKIRILFIGNFGDNRKGHDILFPAVARLVDEGFNLELLVAGNGKELNKNKEKYAKYKEFIFLDRVTDMSHYFSVSDFLIAPSLIDSCPNTILEGINAGIAVYGARTGGIPDLLECQEYMFEPDKESLYIFLKEVLVKKKYTEDAIKQVERRKHLTFDWCQRIKEIIEE